MGSLGMFIVGFASGWFVRSTVDSSRGAVVAGMSAAMLAFERVKRAVAIEREHLEDLVAEARSHYESKRARQATVGNMGPESVRAAQDRAA